MVTLQLGQLKNSDSYLSQAVTADVHGFTVHAPGHNLGKGRAFRYGPLSREVQSARKYTRLHV